MISKSKFKKAVVVGSDSNYEWMIPWWYYFYRKHNNYPVVFIDFGMTPKATEFCKKYGAYIKIEEKRKHIWLLKPLAMLSAPSEKILWIDIDCKINGDLAPIFEYCDKFGCCREVGASKGKNGEAIWGNWNCGVIATNTDNQILKKWDEECSKGMNKIDQFNLTKVCAENGFKVVPMNHLYNWLQRFGDNRDCLIFHYAGRKIDKFKKIKQIRKIGFDFNFDEM